MNVDDPVNVRCPYCGRANRIVLSPETEGTLVQDCEVCCKPWQVVVRLEGDGTRQVRVERAQ